KKRRNQRATNALTMRRNTTSFQDTPLKWYPASDGDTVPVVPAAFESAAPGVVTGPSARLPSDDEPKSPVPELAGTAGVTAEPVRSLPDEERSSPLTALSTGSVASAALPVEASVTSKWLPGKAGSLTLIKMPLARRSALPPLWCSTGRVS